MWLTFHIRIPNSKDSPNPNPEPNPKPNPNPDPNCGFTISHKMKYLLRVLLNVLSAGYKFVARIYFTFTFNHNAL